MNETSLNIADHRCGGSMYTKMGVKLKEKENACLVEIGILVNEDVADTGSVAKDGDLGVLLDVGDQSVATTRNDEIDDVIQSKQGGNSLASADQADQILNA